MKKWIVAVSFTILSLLLAVACIRPAYAGYVDPYMKTQSFSSYIEVYENNTYRVTETISVEFLENRHGIYRNIPIVSYDENNNKVRVKVTDISVDEEFETYIENSNMVIQIGDADYTISGKKEYNISYTIKNQDNKNDNFDLFYLNILPTEWQTAIDEAYVTVNFMKNTDLLNFKLFSGNYGNLDNGKFSANLSGNVIFINSTEPLNAYEGASLRIELPDDYFKGEEQNPFLSFLIIFLSVLALLIVIFLKLMFGRKKDIIPVVSFYPPENMSSADVGYVLDGMTDTKDIISLIIYWADKGLISIEEEDKKTIRLTKLRDINPDSKPYEKVMFSGLFESSDSVTTDELKNTFYTTIDATRRGIGLYYTANKEKRIFKGSSEVFNIIAAILSAVPMAVLIFIGYQIKIVTEAALAIGVVSTIISVGALISWIIVNYKKNSLSKKSFVVLNVFIIAVLLLNLAGEAAAALFILKMPFVTAVSVLCAVVAAFLSRDMRILTDNGLKLTGELVGFKEFIEKAELDRLNALVEENPQYFYKILPFAYVMGLSDKWAKKFENIAIEPPMWYNGYRGSAFNTYLFMHTFNNSINTLQTNMISAPQSKGGGGSFGGFSGGGVGGGGGGSW